MKNILQYTTRIILFFTLGILIMWGGAGSEFNFHRLITGIPQIAEFAQRMIPPDFSITQTIVKATLETIQIALFGTFLRAIGRLFLGICAATNISPKWLTSITKSLLGILRGIPLIILALLFVSTVGLGPFPGVLALALHSTGMLGKFYAEAIENAQPAPLEALRSTGASWLQRMRFGIVTQIAPDLVRDTLFRFELNLRDSLILGLVGAGGIGLYIQLYARSFQFQRVSVLTLVVILMVITIEQASASIRRKLR